MRIKPAPARSRNNPTVFWHTAEDMREVADSSVKLLIGASVHLGKGTPWSEYEKLYHQVYVTEGHRILREDGYLVILQTDPYSDGGVTPRNGRIIPLILDIGVYRFLDSKIWKRKAADLFMVPFTQVFVLGKPGGTASRKPLQSHSGYFQGIWDFPQGPRAPYGGSVFPDGLCKILVEAFTKEGDLIVDAFAGTGRLLGVAAALGRQAIGYEIDQQLKPIVEQNSRAHMLNLVTKSKP